MKKLFFLSLLFIVILAGCKKDDDVKASVEAQLTEPKNGWVFTSMKFGDFDFISLLDACEKDNALIFTSDGKFTIADNTTCEAGDPAIIESGTWSLNSDKTELTINSSDEDGTHYVVQKLSISGDTLNGEISDKDPDSGLTITTTIVMKKKS